MATMNTGIQKYLSPCFQVFGWILCVELISHMIILYLLFLRHYHSFLHWLYHFTSASSTGAWYFMSSLKFTLTPSPRGYMKHQKNCHSNGYEVLIYIFLVTETAVTFPFVHVKCCTQFHSEEYALCQTDTCISLWIHVFLCHVTDFLAHSFISQTVALKSPILQISKTAILNLLCTSVSYLVKPCY